MKAKTEWRVRMERQAHRDAMHRLKAAYQKLSQETEPKEVRNETDSCVVCPCFDATPGRGGHDSQPGGGD
ncbi:MAG: hypothetical protein IPM84_12880 [Anaerolineae bacterium]|nr:hypothetical protein [Anaerolineae bacterium]